jgi:DNA-binding NarL/FixJ family response regulator
MFIAENCERAEPIEINSDLGHDLLSNDRVTSSLFLIDTCGLAIALPALLRDLRTGHPENRFLVLLPASKFTDKEIIDLLHLGVHGVLKLSDSLSCLLPDAIECAFEGRLFVPARVLARYVAETYEIRRKRGILVSHLTRREIEVLDLLLNDRANKEVAAVLGISERTVKFHISNLLRKSGAHDRHGLRQIMLPVSYGRHTIVHAVVGRNERKNIGALLTNV